MVWMKNVVLRGESIDTGLHVETEAFEFQEVKETDVKSVIKSLAANKAPGYDKISARVLKDSCESIAPVISRLVNIHLRWLLKHGKLLR